MLIETDQEESEKRFNELQTFGSESQSYLTGWLSDSLLAGLILRPKPHAIIVSDYNCPHDLTTLAFLLSNSIKAFLMLFVGLVYKSLKVH